MKIMTACEPSIYKACEIGCHTPYEKGHYMTQISILDA